MTHRIDPAVLAELAAHTAQWSGFQPTFIQPEVLERALEPELREGAGRDQLLARARSREARLETRLLQAVSVGETYFFRGGEQFRFLYDLLRTEGMGVRAVRVWSAGCATGEEAWSLAACLDAARAERPGLDFTVLGTDLLARNVERASAGVYPAWSVRASSPLLFPVFEGAGRKVRAALRPKVRFEAQNLLARAPEGPFDVIFCRNVLIYFAPEAAARVVSHLLQALAPGGLLFFAPMDLLAVPPELRPLGPCELQAFVRGTDPRAEGGGGADTGTAPAARATSPLPAPPTWRPPDLSARTLAPPFAASRAAAPSAPRPAEAAPLDVAVPAVARPTYDLVALHVRALEAMERGEAHQAEAIVGALVRKSPGYLPGLFEWALLCARAGRRSEARGTMREVLARCEAMPPDAPVAGPEELPASFYLAAARTFLANPGEP